MAQFNQVSYTAQGWCCQQYVAALWVDQQQRQCPQTCNQAILGSRLSSHVTSGPIRLLTTAVTRTGPSLRVSVSAVLQMLFSSKDCDGLTSASAFKPWRTVLILPSFPYPVANLRCYLVIRRLLTSDSIHGLNAACSISSLNPQAFLQIRIPLLRCFLCWKI